MVMGYIIREGERFHIDVSYLFYTNIVKPVHSSLYPGDLPTVLTNDFGLTAQDWCCQPGSAVGTLLGCIADAFQFRRINLYRPVRGIITCPRPPNHLQPGIRHRQPPA